MVKVLVRHTMPFERITFVTVLTLPLRQEVTTAGSPPVIPRGRRRGA